MQETWVQSLGQEDSLEEEMATPSSILAWRIPRTEEPVGYSPWAHKQVDMTESLTLFPVVTLLSSTFHALVTYTKISNGLIFVS